MKVEYSFINFNVNYMEWYWILLIIVAILAFVIPFSLAVINVIKFDEAWLITLFIWLLPLELIVIIAIALIKFYDFLRNIKTK